VLIDPTKLNVFEIIYPFLGAGTIQWRVMSPDGHFHVFHRTTYPGSATVPSQSNPTYRISWVAASLGSATNLTCAGASGAIFNEGISESARDPFALSGSFTAATTEYVAFALRVRGEFGSRVNLREILPHTINAAVETTNRSVTVRCYLNPTMSGTVNWARVDATSAMDYATPTTITPASGRLIAAASVATGGGRELELHELDIRLEPGDVLAISLTAASNTAVTAIGVNWQEV
jgi:hypothetical protein